MKHILVVDDDPLIRGILIGIVGCRAVCDEAENGEVAFDKYRLALDSGRSYDMAFIDISMPVMNGRKLLRAIRGYETKLSIPEKSRLKAIIISAVNSPRRVADVFFEDSCNDYIIKPFKIEAIIAILDKYKIQS